VHFTAPVRFLVCTYSLHQSRLEQLHLVFLGEKIIETYDKPETIDKYSYVATLDEIKENDYNLNIPRYVDTFEEEKLVEMDVVKEEISNIKQELQEVEALMEKYLKELGL
jgi:type I restriction enzyme M protein